MTHVPLFGPHTVHSQPKARLTLSIDACSRLSPPPRRGGEIYSNISPLSPTCLIADFDLKQYNFRLNILSPKSQDIQSLTYTPFWGCS